MNRSWLVFRFFNVVSFVYNSWCINGISVGPPTRLPQTSVDSAGSHVNQRPDKVLLTRRRWDAYMMPLFLGLVAFGIVRIWQTGQFRFALAPVAVIPLWMMLRRGAKFHTVICSTSARKSSFQAALCCLPLRLSGDL